MSEDDAPGAGGLADLVVSSRPQETSKERLESKEDTARHRQLIKMAKAVKVLRETQPKAERGTKHWGGPTAESQPRKALKPSAALGRAPEGQGMSVETGAPMAAEALGLVERGMPVVTIEDALEAYLLDGGHPGPAAMPIKEPTQPATSQANITGIGLGGFGVELRGLIPKGGPKWAPIATLIVRRSGPKWSPMLKEPTMPMVIAAMLLA